MNSTRTTYLPRVMPDNPNLPSEFVAAAYFFPVSVLAAVTVTPGSEVLPLRTEPLIHTSVLQRGPPPTATSLAVKEVLFPARASLPRKKWRRIGVGMRPERSTSNLGLPE